MILYSSIARDRRVLRTGLLIDLENLAYTADGRLIGARALGERLDLVLALAGQVEHRLVAAQHHVLVRYGAELAARNLRWQECSSGPDEADRALTQAGLGLLLRGYGRIVIASGDHHFAPFGDLCDLRVAVPSGIPISAKLAAAATVLAPSAALSGHASPTPVSSTHLRSVPVSAAA
jgi:hypothetical protein